MQVKWRQSSRERQQFIWKSYHISAIHQWFMTIWCLCWTTNSKTFQERHGTWQHNRLTLLFHFGKNAVWCIHSNSTELCFHFQVLPFINGINHVSRIATDSDVEIGLVKACIQNLVYYQVVEVLPLFKYSNVYMCTRNLQKLSTDNDLMQACRWFLQIIYVLIFSNYFENSLNVLFPSNLIFHKKKLTELRLKQKNSALELNSFCLLIVVGTLYHWVQHRRHCHRLWK